MLFGETEARIGQRVKKERQFRGWTQKFVAHKLGFPDSSYISRIESGKRQVNTKELGDFAKLFNVSLDHLLFGHTGDDF